MTASGTAPRPVVGVTACFRRIEPHDFHVAADPYVAAVADGAGATPLLIPALGGETAFEVLLDRLDGLLVTGSPSNVAPERYGGVPSAPGTPHDPARDATVLPLIRLAVARGCPVLAICRGFQEMNVAYGGTLHQRVHEVPGLADHRADPARPVDEQFAPAHPVRLADGGMLAALAGSAEVTVNSVHGQGIDRLAAGLRVEATAPDGLVEAVTVPTARHFAIGVQWHPEWRWWEDRLSTALLRRFGAACRDRAEACRRPAPATVATV